MINHSMPSLLLVLAFVAMGWRSGEMEIKMTGLTNLQLSVIKSLKNNGDIQQEGNTVKATMYVIPSELGTIEAAGISYEITIPDMKSFCDSFWTKQKTHAVHSDAYHSTDEILSLMDSLANAFPSICRKIALGTSTNGRELCMLKISKDVSIHGNKAQICFDAGIHGDEIGGPENLIRFAKFLCTSYSTDTAISSMINSREIFIYCMVNPDGRDSMSRYNGNGIDCNRNEGYMWSGEDGTDAPFSQAETRALRTAMLSHQFAIQMSYHSGAIEILYPWGWSGSSSPDVAHHKVLSALYMSSSGYSGNYNNCSSYADYPTHGETVDYAYGTMGTAVFTFELSKNKEFPADSIAYYYNLNLSAVKKMIQYAGYGISGILTDSSNGNPVAAMLFCGSSFPFYSDSGLGDYHKFVKAGTYSLIVKANGYKSKTVSVTAQDAGVTETDILLQPDTMAKKCYGYRVITIDSATGNTYTALGMPDSQTCVLRRGSADSVTGITIDMQYPVADSTGNEIFVYVYGTTSTYTCYAGQSPDGPWKMLGTGTKSDSFDLSAGSLSYARYIRIKGTNCGLDAVAGSWKYRDATGTYGSCRSLPHYSAVISVHQSNGYVKFEMKDSNLPFRIFDMKGRCCYSDRFNNGACFWLSPARGVYMFETIGGSGLSAIRFLVR
jgi:hypothetical protein